MCMSKEELTSLEETAAVIAHVIAHGLRRLDGWIIMKLVLYNEMLYWSERSTRAL